MSISLLKEVYNTTVSRFGTDLLLYTGSESYNTRGDKKNLLVVYK